jgi:hypothetical protein
MGYTPEDLSNPYTLFEIRTREVRSRIQILENDLVVARHIITKGIIIDELNTITDDYVERKSLFTRVAQTDDNSD